MEDEARRETGYELKAITPISLKKPIYAFLIVILALFGGCAKSPESRYGREAKLEDEEIPILSGKDRGRADIKVKGLDEEQKILSFDMAGYSDEGAKAWDIRGRSADVISDTVILEHIEANAYDEDRTVNLSAKKGVYDKRNNTIKLENEVIVKTSDGIVLSADWLRWNAETEKIDTDSFVKVEKKGFCASGKGAIASTKHKEVQLDRHIKVRQGDVEVTCRGPLSIDYNNNKASFYGDVETTDSRGKLYADRLDIIFDPDSQEMEKVIAENNVSLVRGEDVAKGEKIIYDVVTGQAELTGAPEIRIYSREGLDDAFTKD